MSQQKDRRCCSRGGIIGCSTAYFLTVNYGEQVRVTVVERYKVAGYASGKAGGFLAGGWGDDDTSSCTG